jgi:hypothetical protein
MDEIVIPGREELRPVIKNGSAETAGGHSPPNTAAFVDH